MGPKSYSDELEWALARPDAERMCQQVDAYATYIANDDGGDWPKEHADDFDEITWSFRNDPDKAFAYIILGASRADDAGVSSQRPASRTASAGC